jgi:serine O-acetyltransferase
MIAGVRKRLIKSVKFMLIPIAEQFVTDDLWELREKAICSKGISRDFWIILYNRYLHNYGADIPLEARIMSRPKLPHDAYGIFISKGATIGVNCVIFQHVTIGSNTLRQSERRGSPVIGDNCYIGAGAKIIGNIKVGNNCRIGANCVVVEDVPDSSVVVLQKSRVLVKSNLENTFLNYNETS